MSSATFYKWNGEPSTGRGGMDASLMACLKEREDENGFYPVFTDGEVKVLKA